MLAKIYEGQDVTGWMVSEKLDGVRAIWTGTEFISRAGKPINAPNWFKSKMPMCELDGELWLGRGQFQKCVGIVRKKQPVDSEWIRIKYMVFDMPSINKPFEERYDMLQCLLMTNTVSSAVEQEDIQDDNHRQEIYNKIVRNGGEGTIYRHPQSMYEERRSPYMLKEKPIATDEAVVVGYQEGEGKHTGRMGALLCRWQDKDIKVGTGFTDDEREDPPSIGATITFSYQELTNDGMPRFPVYITVRDYE
jgi:DNA ligase-1